MDPYIRSRWNRDRHRHWHGHGGLVGGVILAGIGVLLLLQNLGIPGFDDLERYWPVILIVVGVAQASRSIGMGGRVWGGAIMAVGALFLLSNFGLIHGDVWRFLWPGVLIIAGLGMLARNVDRHAGGGSGPGPESKAGVAYGEGLADRIKSKIMSDVGASHWPVSPNHLNEWVIFSGSRRRIDSQDFQGGEAFAMFGGIELDMRKAASTLQEIVIEVNAVFGGIEVRVPENWNVTVRGAGIFGGYEDKIFRAPLDAKQPHLIVNGFAVFGGVTIQN